MIEIRFHGRGGQGAVIASELLAHAAFRDGRIPQSFPFFGVERRGAPVTAFTRLDDKPIGVRTSITTPDIVVVLEHGLMATQPVSAGLRAGGLLLVNTRLAPEKIAAGPGVRRATVDATAIAVRNGLGTTMLPIVNTAILGALSQASGVVSLAALEAAIDEHVPARRAENRQAARDGFGAVRLAGPGAAEAPKAVALSGRSRTLPDGPVADVPTTTLATGAWRTLRPVVHLEGCTRCNFCWKFCPDVAIGFDEKGYPVIQLEHCKGCGICAEECPPKVIAMVAEAEEAA